MTMLPAWNMITESSGWANSTAVKAGMPVSSPMTASRQGCIPRENVWMESRNPASVPMPINALSMVVCGTESPSTSPP
jgi:hypothetical protein